jgi:hypothetical protein
MIHYRKIAQLCHEANRIYCASHGDMSQPEWDDAPEWQRQSAINGVLFHATHPGSTPENSHENWLKEKLEQGWVYGPIKDPELKQHPCCVPYAQLPEQQRFKDHLFTTIVSILTGSS